MPFKESLFDTSHHSDPHAHCVDALSSAVSKRPLHDATSFASAARSANFLSIDQEKHSARAVSLLGQAPQQRYRHGTSFADDDEVVHGPAPKPLDTTDDQLKEIAKEDEDTQHMLLEEARIPDKEKMGSLASDCKLEATGHAEEVDQVQGSAIGTEIVAGAKCVETAGNVLLKDFFGVGLKDADTQPGTKFVQAEAGIKIGEMQHDNLEAVKDACHDFASLTLNRFGDRKDDFKLKGDPEAILTSRNASQELRSFGRCLGAMGMTTAWQGCEMGDLQSHGGEIAKQCEEIEGEAKYHWAGCQQQ